MTNKLTASFSHKDYNITDTGIQLLATEYYGTVKKQTTRRTTIEFTNVIVSLESETANALNPAEIVLAEILLEGFHQALSSFKKDEKL